MFTITNSSYCSIVSYEIVKADGSAIISNDDEYSRFELANRIDELRKKYIIGVIATTAGGLTAT
jgi:hypothetical protein